MTLAFRCQVCTVTRMNAARCKMDRAIGKRCNEHARPIQLHGQKVTDDRTNFKDTMLLGRYAGYIDHLVQKPLRFGNFNGDTGFPLRRSWHPAMNKMKCEGSKNFATRIVDYADCPTDCAYCSPGGPSWKRTPLSDSAHGSLGSMLWSSPMTYSVYKYSEGILNLLHQCLMMEVDTVSETSDSSPTTTWFIARKDFTAHRSLESFKSCKGQLQ
jgi:hypothetical protein